MSKVEDDNSGVSERRGERVKPLLSRGFLDERRRGNKALARFVLVRRCR